ncbi:hypothetical protein ACTFIR_007328 [Dictyostelium discoideum]
MSSLSNLKEQLEKKRKEAQLKNSNNNNNNNSSNNINNNSVDKSEEPATKKYKTRGEIDKELKQKKEEERIKKEKEKEKENYNNNNNNSNVNKNENSINIDNNDNNNKINKLKENEGFLPDIVVIQRLRERSQPITYFGETSIDRAMRLKKLEENDPIEYTQGDNEFANILKQIEQRKMKKHQDSADNEKEKEENENNNNNKKKQQQQLQQQENEESEEQELERLRIDSSTCKESKILYFLKGLLNDWITNLENRSDDEKKSRQGKIAEATYYQCRSHIQPLFTSLRDKTLSIDILEHINEIVEFCKSREYVRANDEYLQMAIGNAPWPMGVTMVGIHERSSREKIFSNQVAHVLNDEMQRKYIQAVKRLMTFCQTQYPTAPSRSIG